LLQRSLKLKEILDPEGWDEPKRILLVLAHPDDPEFFCGATIARWTAAGHEVHYLLLTGGDKGSQVLERNPAELVHRRQVEQRAAASILGVKSICFLSYDDGELLPDQAVRRDIVRQIRTIKPHILVTSDPSNYFPRGISINHTDHRAAGEAALAAAFPAGGNPNYFPELIDTENLDPHAPGEVWVTLTHQPDFLIDITPYWPVKIQALHAHASQIGDPTLFDERMRSRRTPESTEENPIFKEAFRRIYIR
jgi:LmbE family N-acetylglucosaminyl deacetylase